MYRERCIIREGAGPRPRGFDDLGAGGRGGGLDVNFDSEKTELSFSELKPK